MSSGINGATDCAIQQDLPVGLIPKVAQAKGGGGGADKKAAGKIQRKKYINFTSRGF